MSGVDFSPTYPEQYSILYVDDEPDLLHLGKIFIEKNKDFRVHTISSALKALNSPDIQRYDAILSDYQMPDMDGITFLKEIRKRDKEIPFILFTGRGREEVVIEAINNGANFYVQKGGDPVSQFAELIHKVRQAVKHKQAHTEIINLDTYQKKLASAMSLVNVVHWEYDAYNNAFTFDDRFFAQYGTSAEREGGTQFSPKLFIEEFIHPDDRELVLSEVKKGCNKTDPGAVTYIEHRIIRRDGEIRNIRTGFSVVRNAEGKIIRTYGANQDITEQKNIEFALEKAYRQINLLTGFTRHDILNNLSVLYNYLDEARIKCPEPCLSEYLNKMEAVIEIIQSRIEFTRIYDKIGSGEPVWIPLSTILPGSPVSIPISYDSRIEKISIFIDPLVKNIFSILIDNSLRHGGHVTEIKISALESGDDLVVVWEDNGVGISHEDKKQIFEMGYGKHTGFGLFMLREILSLTGISILENGNPGIGARFEIIIPKGSFQMSQ
jgi:PAS domain S-box-containing protein